MPGTVGLEGQLGAGRSGPQGEGGQLVESQKVVSPAGISEYVAFMIFILFFLFFKCVCVELLKCIFVFSVFLINEWLHGKLIEQAQD